MLAMFFTLLHWFLKMRGGRLDCDSMQKKYEELIEKLEQVPANEWKVINDHYMTAPVEEGSDTRSNTAEDPLEAGDEQFWI